MKIGYILPFVLLNFIFLGAQSGQKGFLSSRNFDGGASINTLSDSAYQIWVSRYNGPGDDWDEALAIAVDELGNVYVTGGSPPTNGSAFDYATIKYNSSGDQEWAARYTGTPYGVDEAFAIAVDNDGNVYVTGYSSGASSSNDYATIKYNSSGVQQWAARYNGPGNDDDAATSIAIDNSGNVYVTGDSRSNTMNYDYATVKYNSTGNQVWAARYNGTGNNFDQATKVAVDDQGNVFVSGWSAGLSGFYEYATIKYDSMGVQQWVSRYSGPGTGDNICTAMAIDELDNVYITGGSTGETGIFDYATVKYNSSGEQQWASRYDGTVNDFDEAKDIKVDAGGNVYVTGKSLGLESWLDFTTVKYNASGDEEWTARYDGPLHIDDDVSAIALDNSGNIYITGVCVGETSDYDYVTIKYNNLGEQQWMIWFNGPGNMGDRPYGVAIDASGYVYVTGYSFDTSFDYGTIKYGQSSIPVELSSFSAFPDGRDIVLAWATATETNNKGFDLERKIVGPPLTLPSGSSSAGKWEKIAFVAGAGTTAEPQSYSFVDNNVNAGKYSYRLKQIDFDGSYNYSIEVEVQINEPLIFLLNQNYPNPFNPATRINYSIPVGGNVELKVYNILSQEVKTLVNGYKPAGEYSVEFNAIALPSGVYFYRIESGSRSDIKKMILLK